MKWLMGFLVALFMVAPAFAGEDPYIAVVQNDINANQFYLSPKYVQFLYDQTIFAVPTSSETFRAQNPIIQPEICDTLGTGSGPLENQPPFTFRGNANARVTAGNAGWFEWIVALPKKPVGEINLCIQCGVIKPNTFADLGFAAVQYCAAETGERIGFGFCSHQFVDPGIDVIVPQALPSIIVEARPGPYSNIPTGVRVPLRAFRNPGSYQMFEDPGATQLLDGALANVALSRILLKSCMDKCVLIKLPVQGQPTGTTITTLSPIEYDLVEGDLIYVRMNVPRANTVDVYCNRESLKVMGIGESPF